MNDYILITPSQFFKTEHLIERYKDGMLVGCNYISSNNITQTTIQEAVHKIENLGRLVPRL
jgi:hypothetical protein